MNHDRRVKRAGVALGCVLVCLLGPAAAAERESPPVDPPKAAAPGAAKAERKPESRGSKPPAASLDTLRKDGRGKQPATPLGLCDGS